jgi:hypothetical protein
MRVAVAIIKRVPVPVEQLNDLRLRENPCRTYNRC